jgi:hypothetical protein
MAKQVNGYKIGVCIQCWQQAEHGWPAQFEDSLFHALSRQSLLIPDRNEAGYLPRSYAPPADFNL